MPKTLLLISGDAQTGGFGATLPQPLVVVVIGSDGNPFAGATVAWTVTSGVASLNPTTSQSDLNGRAQTTVTLGTTTGTVTITATVAGITPLRFTATIVAPGTLAIESGDAQTGPTGGALALPLRITLLGTNNDPYAGATVTWAVTAGAASVNPATSVTDTAGHAATAVQLGSSPGSVTITATVGGVSPVTFTATIVPVCQYVASYTFATTVTGSLTGNDCLVAIGGGSFYYDYYALTVPGAQQSFTIGLSSTAFDAWLELYKATGTFLALNDDSVPGVFQNSRLNAIMAVGNYVIGVSTYNPRETGGYTLSSATRPATVSGCQQVWITRGITLSETIMATDCRDSSAAGVFYSDRLLIVLDSGDTFEARLQSAAANSSLFLYDLLADTIVAFNDDSATGNPTAFLTYTPDSASFFLLDVGTSVAEQSGPYTLTIAGPAGAASAATHATGTEAPWLRLPALGPARRWPKFAGEELRRAPGR
ncbi:MAG: Ig-like domain-containing protein [Gemmatimonadetes bacterium]|nr:Ig-like domain-containing protein [Gemmatimonadota bacterium]